MGEGENKRSNFIMPNFSTNLLIVGIPANIVFGFMTLLFGLADGLIYLVIGTLTLVVLDSFLTVLFFILKKQEKESRNLVEKFLSSTYPLKVKATRLLNSLTQFSVLYAQINEQTGYVDIYCLFGNTRYFLDSISKENFSRFYRIL